MQPKDVITPSATILGLILTAIGILVSLGGDTNQLIVRNFAFLFIIVVILFVSAVIVTALFSLLKKQKLWSASLILFVAGWSVLGSVLIIVLVGYAYGIETLQIQLPTFDTNFILNILSIIAGLSGLISASLYFEKMRRRLKQLKKLSVELSSAKTKPIEATPVLGLKALGLRNSLTLIRSEIEFELKKLLIGRKNKEDIARVPLRRSINYLIDMGVIKPNLANALISVYRFSSRAVHGDDFPEKEGMLIKDLGLEVLFQLRELNKQRHE